MNPLHGVRKGAWWCALFVLVAAAPAAAQYYADSRQSLSSEPNPLARSPRLTAMGRLLYALDDTHVRADLWEFVHNDAGLLASDSVSTFELVPTTAATSVLHDEADGRATQDQAFRDVRFGFETFRRASGKTAFGVSGDLTKLRNDVPESPSTEQRTSYGVPRAQFVVSGKTPWLPDKLGYGLHVAYRHESRDDDLRQTVSNAAGSFIDQEGSALDPTDIFTPNRSTVQSLGTGLGVSYKVTSGVTAAVRGEYVSNTLLGTNESDRYSSELREDRPFTTWGGSLSGRIQDIEYAAFAESWSSTSELTWVNTLSSGSGQIPANGRGEYADREETGSAMRARAAWKKGMWSVGAGGGVDHRDVDIIAPPSSSTSSFNYYMNYLSGRPGADSLSLPDSVVSNTTTLEGWDVGGGASVHLGWRSSIVGAEVHSRSQKLSQKVGGQGPEPSGFSVRVGAEVSATEALRIRAGYLFQSQDNDGLTEHNEYTGNGVTAGFGLRPTGSLWTVELAYALDWLHADFGDPSRIRSTQQQAMLRVRWDL